MRRGFLFPAVPREFLAAYAIMAEQPWRLDAGSASLRLSRLSAVVHPLDPALGLDELRIDGRLVSAACRPLGVELIGANRPPETVAIEQYVRGGDLVATYADCPAPALRTQIYWRVGSHWAADAIAAVELVISVQTSLLDSSPRLATRSMIAVDEALCISAPDGARQCDTGRSRCYLYRLAETPFSYAEMAHPAQSLESAIETPAFAGMSADAGSKRLELRHQLFHARLEKGVILRARVLGVFLDRRDDQSAAERHYAAFLSAEPPLTT
jgi:hypothetical protein